MMYASQHPDRDAAVWLAGTGESLKELGMGIYG